MRAIISVVLFGACCAACSIPEKHLTDGGQGPFSCLGKDLPTSAPPQITITGTVMDPFTGAPVANDEVDGYFVQDQMSSMVFTLSTGADGSFSRAQGTGNFTRDAFLHSFIAGFVDTFLYPPVPVASDVHEDVVMFTPDEIGTLAMVAGVTVDPAQPVILIDVVDCNGSPVGGATVATIPAGHVTYFVKDTPNPSAVATDEASGVAMVTGLAPGSTVIQGSVGGMTLRMHTVDSTGGTLLQTSIQP